MRIRNLIVTLTMPMCLHTSAATYFQAWPSGSKFPSNMHTENINGVVPSEGLYKNGYTADGWTVDAADATTYAFIAPSHSGYGAPMESCLSTDSFTVESGDAWLRWNARSMLPGFLEDYDVVVNNLTDGTSNIVESIEAESHDWTTRLVPLSDFAGKEITISFICKSVDKYMLAVKNIYAGEFDSHEWVVREEPNRYAAIDGEAVAKGTIRNVGKELENASIICRTSDQEMTSEISGTWSTGLECDYSFVLPVSLNESTPYSIGVSDRDGNFTELVSSDVFTSNFVRNLVVDEGTSTWCNNCPNGILTIDKLKAEYGDNIIILSCHTGNDVMAMSDYWTNLKFYAVPYFMLNRNRNTIYSDTRNFSNGYQTPTVAEIILPQSIVSTDGLAEVEATTRFAEDIDNSDGRYKIGYTVIADIHRDVMPYYQENIITLPRGEQYYFLPSVIPPALARFENVVLSEEYAFSGIEGSIPANVVAMEGNSCSFSVVIPDEALDAENVRLVAYIIDTTTGGILNGAACAIDVTTGIKSIFSSQANADMSITVTPDHRCSISGIADDAEVVVTVTDATGRIFDRINATKITLSERTLRLPAGIAIITATSSGKTAVAKHISINN